MESPRRSGNCPTITVIAIPKMKPWTTGTGIIFNSLPAPTPRKSIKNNAANRVRIGMAAMAAFDDETPTSANMDAVIAMAAESIPKTTLRVDVNMANASGAMMDAHRPYIAGSPATCA